MLLRRRAIMSGNIIETSTGKSPVFAEGAKAGKIPYLAFDGNCLQAGTPSPEKPVPVYSLGKDIDIVSTSVSGDAVSYRWTLKEPLRKVYKVSDSIDSSGRIVRRCAEKILNGSEKWEINTALKNVNRFFSPLDGAMNIASSTEKNTVLCSHFSSSSSVSEANASRSAGCVFHFHGTLWFYTDAGKFPSVESFKKWLCANPVTVIYALAGEKEERAEVCDISMPDGDSFISVYRGDVVSQNIKVRYRKK